MSTVFRLALAVLACAPLSACAYGHRIAYHVFEGPLDAIAIAHVAPDKIVVLAGTIDDGKNVSVFYDSIYSQEIMRFPVSRFASSVRDGIGGTFFLSVAVPQGAARGDAPRGAIEEWNLHGQLLSSVKFPAPVESLSRATRSDIYGLMRDGKHAIAVGVRLASGTSFRSVRLADDVQSLDRCSFRHETYLLVSSPARHRVRLIDTSTGTVIDTPMLADRARCFPDFSTIVGVEHHPLGVNVALLRLSATDQRIDEAVAPFDTVQLEPTDDGRLFLLRRSGGNSNIQIWTHAEVADLGR